LADKVTGIRKCRAPIPCPPGRCCRGYLEALTESRLREYSQILGPEGAGNFWELGALASVGERPDPGRLDDRNDMVRELRSRQNASETGQE
jgi:hypothetical protein